MREYYNADEGSAWRDLYITGPVAIPGYGQVFFGIEIEDTYHWGDREPGAQPETNYYASVECIAPGLVPEKELANCRAEMGYSKEEMAQCQDEQAMYAEALSRHGCTATLWEQQCSEPGAPEKLKALAEAQVERFATDLAAFREGMSRQQNNSGAQGWDFIVGELEHSEERVL